LRRAERALAVTGRGDGKDEAAIRDEFSGYFEAVA
jgi:hypothetical protein